MPLPRTSWRRRPLLVLIILILLLLIGYAARAFDSDSATGSQPADARVTNSQSVTEQVGLILEG